MFGPIPTIEEMVNSIAEEYTEDLEVMPTDEEIVAAVKHDIAVENGEITVIDDDEEEEEEEEDFFFLAVQRRPPRGYPRREAPMEELGCEVPVFKFVDYAIRSLQSITIGPSRVPFYLVVYAIFAISSSSSQMLYRQRSVHISVPAKYSISASYFLSASLAICNYRLWYGLYPSHGPVIDYPFSLMYIHKDELPCSHTWACLIDAWTLLRGTSVISNQCQMVVFALQTATTIIKHPHFYVYYSNAHQGRKEMQFNEGPKAENLDTSIISGAISSELCGYFIWGAILAQVFRRLRAGAVMGCQMVIGGCCSSMVRTKPRSGSSGSSVWLIVRIIVSLGGFKLIGLLDIQSRDSGVCKDWTMSNLRRYQYLFMSFMAFAVMLSIDLTVEYRIFVPISPLVVHRKWF
ncbi:uncharacterized protein BT62DRAFT_1000611 [Guyanagaster necrorhizus]|uniref:Uncharacterized protein n=1 Tax=Guyanagaster necrorhizus TaxID=856835 RepID=A0A9P7W141_9AGAR|nr:uncharacterized protein BT62DRAFT_1000611 [Guyanagaster necrorhizus MCA 3950]KAG7451366.1 hypothetical protein BT62DRAFT_1000611 [Guyanagaster necrorhizus MCA 3950]